MIGHLLALAVPVAGVLTVLILAAPAEPTKPGTSTKPEGSDHR
jgi:hypothetical protein